MTLMTSEASLSMPGSRPAFARGCYDAGITSPGAGVVDVQLTLVGAAEGTANVLPSEEYAAALVGVTQDGRVRGCRGASLTIGGTGNRTPLWVPALMYNSCDVGRKWRPRFFVSMANRTHPDIPVKYSVDLGAGTTTTTISI
jgi:hypothetical protein